MNLLFAITALQLILFSSALVNVLVSQDVEASEDHLLTNTKTEMKSEMEDKLKPASYDVYLEEKSTDSENKEENITALNRTARSARNNVVVGRLKVYIKNGTNLPDTDPWLNDPDPFVRVTAVYDTQSSKTLNTKHIGGTRYPVWNQWLDFGAGRFQCLQMSVWDEDSGATGGDDRMTNTQSFTVRPGNHRDVKHCNNAECNRFVYFSYYLDEDGNECSPNPCQNNGTCLDRISSYVCSCNNGYVGPQCQYNFCLSNPCRNGGTCTSTTTSYTCSCPRGYGGNRCQHTRGRLRIYARNGHNLPDEDGWLNNPDPYFEARAYSHAGHFVYRRTRHIGGNRSPTWNQWLDFGYGEWSRFTVQIWDLDTGGDDVLSSRVTYYPSLGCHRGIKLCGSRGCGGYVFFDYCFEV